VDDTPDFPPSAAKTDDVARVPRRIRGYLAGTLVLDTTAALYVWEWPYYPQYYVPVTDVLPARWSTSTRRNRIGAEPSESMDFEADLYRPGVAKLFTESPIDGLTGTVRIDWSGLDSWFEEDEQVFVHPRSLYVRVDALRSSRVIRVELDGVLLARTQSPVLLFETGLPTRYYLPRTDLRLENLVPSDSVSECPYKGATTGYYSAVVGGSVHQDVAWTYDFPTRQVLPIAGLVAFYQEKVSISVDGVAVPKPPARLVR
jgi:uncharacterized protein (DUF427 family)